MTLRADFEEIIRLVPQGVRVLDVGCGDGQLLDALRARKNVDARGVELSRENVAAAMARGLSVIQGDADSDLRDYPTGAFDLVILSQTLQAMRQPAVVLEELLRIGRSAIVSFPNFGHWRVRAALALGGRMPKTKALPVEWYETSNIHLCTVQDFEDLVAARAIHVEQRVFLSSRRPVRLLPNVRAAQAIYKLTRQP